MFARASTTFVLALPVLAAANVLPRQSNQCNTGTLQCCESTQSAVSASKGLVGILLGLLGVVLTDLTAQVGASCTPITVIGAGGTSCSEQPVCCTNNIFNGLIALGCTPININL